MIKFKTFFRKGHGSSNSGSGGSKGRSNSVPADRLKTNHSELAAPVSHGSESNYDNDFEKPVTPAKSVECAKLNDLNIDINESDENITIGKVISEERDVIYAEKEMEYETVKKQLQTVIEEKINLEDTLQELIKSHGELESLRKEIDTLKVCCSIVCFFLLTPLPSEISSVI